MEAAFLVGLRVDPWVWRVVRSGLFVQDPIAVGNWPLRTLLEALTWVDIEERRARDRERARKAAESRRGMGGA